MWRGEVFAISDSLVYQSDTLLYSRCTHEYIIYRNFHELNTWAVVVLFYEYEKHVWLRPQNQNSLTGKCVFCMHNCLIITKIIYYNILLLFTQSKYICILIIKAYIRNGLNVSINKIPMGCVFINMYHALICVWR